jgi:hypothetical protein
MLSFSSEPLSSTLLGFVSVVTWWCTLREDYRLKVLDNRLLGRVFQVKGRGSYRRPQKVS